MAESAIVGQPPKTDLDRSIIQGLYYTFGWFDDVDTSKGMLGVYPSAPPGYVHESKAREIVGVAVSMFIVQFSITAARLFLRYFSPRMVWGWDDWTIIPGVLLALTSQVLLMTSVIYGGAGRHVWEVTYTEFDKFHTFVILRGLTMWPAVGVIKVSISLFNLRLTAVASRGWRCFNIFLLCVNVAYTIFAVFSLLFACKPISFVFSKDVGLNPDPVPSCYNVYVWSKVLSYTHIVLDFLLLMTPVWVIMKVKLRLGNRIRLLFLFCLGSISCVSSVLRVKAGNTQTVDTTYTFTGLLAWNVLDLSMSVVVASLPVFNSLFTRCRTAADAEGGPSNMQLSFPSSLSNVASNEEDTNGEKENKVETHEVSKGVQVTSSERA